MARCQTHAAEPLTTGDQFDTARALAQANGAFKECKARHDALIDAVVVRDELAKSVKQQLDGSK